MFTHLLLISFGSGMSAFEYPAAAGLCCFDPVSTFNDATSAESEDRV